MRARIVLAASLSLSVVLGACAEVGPAWTPIDTHGVAPRWGHVALVDVTRDRMLVLGGENDFGPQSDVLALDLATLAWSTVPTTNRPSARTDFAAALDTPRDRVIVVGGRQGLAMSTGEIWALDLTTLAWSPLPGGPAARHDVSAVTDGAHLWVFGGAGDFLQSLDDLWELDLATDTWRLLPAPGDHPSARTSYAFAVWQGSLWMRGGHDAVTAYHDTWRYHLDTERWERVAASGDTVAGAHFGHALDPTCGQLLMTGGDNLDNFDTSFTDALVLGDAARIVRVPASGMPTPRDHPSLVVDDARRRMILFGGGAVGDGLGTRNDAWTRPLGACP